MSERRQVIDEGVPRAEADALANMLSGVDARVEELERTRPACRVDHAALARLIEGMDARVEAAVERALVAHSARLGKEDDPHLPPIARRAADVATRHWWSGVSDRGMKFVVGAVLIALLIWLGSLGIVFRGVPKA